MLWIYSAVHNVANKFVRYIANVLARDIEQDNSFESFFALIRQHEMLGLTHCDVGKLVE